MNAMSRLTDEELVKHYAEGNDDAFNVLLGRYRRKVYSYILLGVKDHDLANDIFQDTFVKAITTIRRRGYSEMGKFSGWIMRIAHNLIIDHFRHAANDCTVCGDDEDAAGNTLLNTLPVYDSNIEDEMVEQQVLADVSRLVEALPQVQRDVLKMRFYQDLSFKEIADLTGVSINTALGRMRYALMNLRKMAEDKHLSLSA